MTITMRMLARIFFFATEVTQGPLSSVHYTHIKRSPKSRCAICSGFEDTAKMSPRSRGTCPPDLAGDQVARRLTRRNVVCEVQNAIPDVHCAVDLNCGYNAILQRHLHTRICQSPIPLPLTHCLLHMRPETAQTLLSHLPQTTNTWRMHSIPPNTPT